MSKLCFAVSRLLLPWIRGVLPWVNFVLPWINGVLPWVNFVLPSDNIVFPWVKFEVPWLCILPWQLWATVDCHHMKGVTSEGVSFHKFPARWYNYFALEIMNVKSCVVPENIHTPHGRDLPYDPPTHPSRNSNLASYIALNFWLLETPPSSPEFPIPSVGGEYGYFLEPHIQDFCHTWHLKKGVAKLSCFNKGLLLNPFVFLKVLGNMCMHVCFSNKNKRAVTSIGKVSVRCFLWFPAAMLVPQRAFIYLFIYLFIYYLFIYLFSYLFIYLFIYLFYLLVL